MSEKSTRAMMVFMGEKNGEQNLRKPIQSYEQERKQACVRLFIALPCLRAGIRSRSKVGDEFASPAAYIRMNRATSPSHALASTAVSPRSGLTGVPWLQLQARISEGLVRRNFYV